MRQVLVSYNREWRDPQARLTRPLRRVGPKGEGRFEPVSWDMALAAIADRFKQVVATGTALDGFDPRTARDAACLVVWGANPSASGPHAHEHWLREVPDKVVVIDPIRPPTAQAADLHLQPFPGSDAALAFALLHVLWRDGLIDADFVAAHTVGWEELEPLLADCTPAWGEATTGVPARLIEEAAHLYGRGPSLLWLGLGLQRQPTGGNVIRACALLPAVTGNLGEHGAGFLYLNWHFNAPHRYLDDAYLTASHLAMQTPPSISHMDLAACLEDPTRAQALVCWNINIAASNPEQARLRRALMREDLFTIVLDLFPTDTMDFTDFVLPAARFLEFDDLVAGYFHLSLSAQVKAMEPLGEALQRPLGAPCKRSRGNAPGSCRKGQERFVAQPGIEKRRSGG